jgi:hypothetical protein
MKYPLAISAIVLLTISVTFAQVASHAPTQFSTPQKTTIQPTGKTGGASERDGAYGPRFAA